VPDEGAKAALLAEEPDVCFTTAHFDGSPKLMCRLDALDQQSLTELAAEVWTARAPRRLLAEHLPGPAWVRSGRGRSARPRRRA
jgi:hypothetical protein